jgi:PAS domain S-box-containing protein
MNSKPNKPENNPSQNQPMPTPSAPKTPPPRPPLEAIIASAPGFIFLLSPEGRYLYANRRAKRGSSEEEIGKLLEQVLAPEQAAELRALMRRVEGSGRPRTVELGAVDAIGRPRRYIVTLSPFLVLGRVEGFVGIGMDVTASDDGPTDTRAAELAARLTPKQREVLVLVAEGLSSREIGERLGVGERTVETHREQLMDRLEIRGVAALARFALSAGLL